MSGTTADAQQSGTQDAGAEASTSGEAPQESMPFETHLTERFRGRFQTITPPSYEMMMQEDIMNNCGVKSVMSGVMGGALGAAFGIFTASLDTGVSAYHTLTTPECPVSRPCRRVILPLNLYLALWGAPDSRQPGSMRGASLRSAWSCIRYTPAPPALLPTMQGIDGAPIDNSKPTRVLIREGLIHMRNKAA